MNQDTFEIMEKSYVDLLAEALYEGDVLAEDFKVMPGKEANVSPEARAKALYESMKRVGVIRDGFLVKID